MVKMIFIWFILSAIIAIGLIRWRTLTGKEQWKMVKTIACAAGCSLLAILLLSVFVFLF